MWPFAKKSFSNVAIFDIGLGSVGAGLLHVPEKGKPVLCYTERIPLTTRQATGPDEVMLAALKLAGELLVREGSPALRQRAGSASIDHIVVNVGCPWQKTQVRTEKVRPGKPFTFTKAVLEEVLNAPGDTEEGYLQLEQRVIATLLNGYAVEHPLGKYTERAEMVILSSQIRIDVGERIMEVLRSLFHTKHISIAAFAPAGYEVLRKLYPHEGDFLMLSVSGACTDVANVRGGHLTDAGALACGTNALIKVAREVGKSVQQDGQGEGEHIKADQNVRLSKEVEKAEDAWLSSLTGLLREFASRNALPRMIFLIAQDETRDFLAAALDTPTLRALWLSDEPVSVIPILPRQFANHIAHDALAGADLALEVLALYASRQ